MKTMLMWESYLDTAAEFVRLAGRVSDPALKLKLMDMAWLWLQIADQAEKNSRADLVYETPHHPEHAPLQ
jgi:hypothetical protein